MQEYSYKPTLHFLEYLETCLVVRRKVKKKKHILSHGFINYTYSDLG